MARILFALGAALCAETAFAGPTDPATLFPDRPLAYAEVGRPAEAIKQLNALIKGSVFEDALPAINKIRDKQGGGAFVDTSAAGLFATLVGPEMRKESARFDGAAAALLGFDKQGEPEWVAVLLTGDSQLPAFLVRGYLSAHPEMRKVGEAEGFDLYQERSTAFIDDPLLGLPNAPNVEGPVIREVRITGPVLAFKEGAVVFASDRASASGLLRRLKGSEKNKSLADNPGFQAIRKRDFPGLFVYAEPAPFLQRLVGGKKLTDEHEPAMSFALRKLVPPASLREFAAFVSVEGDQIACDAVLKLNPDEPNLLARLLTGRALEPNEEASSLSVGLNLPPGPQRVDSVLQTLDTIIKATGTLGPTASEIAAELELKKVLSREALHSITRVSLMLPPASGWKGGKLPLPTVLVRSESEEGLQALAAAVPAILELLGGEPADAVTEMIDDVKVRSLEAKASPRNRPVHYAIANGWLALGENRHFLASCLKPGRRDNVQTRNATAFPLVARWNWPQSLTAKATEPSQFGRYQMPLAEGTSNAVLLDQPRRGASLPDKNVVAQEFPPLAVMMSATHDEIRLKVVQSDPTGDRAKLLNHWFDTYASGGGRGFPKYGYGGRTIVEWDAPLILPLQVQNGPQ